MHIRSTSWLAGAAVLALATVAATPAFAQDAQSLPQGADAADSEQGQIADAADSEQGQILVTGSRIRRDPLDNSSPIVTVDSEAIAKTGLSSVADVLQRLPSSAGVWHIR